MAREQRRLAAIVSADVVGYSRLMGRDESGTLARLREHRKQRLEPSLARLGGRLVKLTGDGALVEFASAVDALSAAIEFQQAMAEANQDQPEDTCIVFRIGLHLGDLIVDGNDLYGDGVNVAARLEAEAPAGGIVISRTVHEAVSGRVKAMFDDLGNLALKNIDRPVQAFGVTWDPMDWKVGANASSIEDASPAIAAPLALPDRPSIAVLPFQNMSGDPEQEYVADGMAEDIITELSRFKSLFVIARNSSFAYKGKSPDIRQVGRELGVRYVLEGSVRKGAGRLRITAQLVEAAGGAHLWAERFDGALEDVFELQDGITEKVVTAIAPRMDLAEMARARRKATGTLDAHDCYWRGLAALRLWTREGMAEALSLATRAIELDPDHAAAYGLAMYCYSMRRGWGQVDDPEADKTEVMHLSRAIGRIAQDDASTLGHAAFAFAFVLHDLAAAKRLIDQAATLNPNLASTWLNSGWIHLWLGHPDIAVDHLARVMRYDPLDIGYTQPKRTGMAHACFFLDRMDDAIDWAERQLRDTPDSVPALRIGAAAAALAGRSELAERLAAHLLRGDPAFRVSRLREYVGPYQRADFIEKYAEGLRRAGLPE